ncbi:multiple monosaccharide ABC transporter substrate-binding protein [Subtercola boreus]|uniref:Sugar ABC transporter substrate-binding protein n=1 Tax=Subtercola boreus TaxID=120213 RepID=A0A3E0WEB5_9MICO|nr:multiple monosaccharide ABC transporter substrate-binding protein [Subtercola boreus]RFA23578.1 sugar ABC transporter substrate-binding protein [Subtercola boreus]RFA23972.1 sugar ABC transporter substrate-binding protein [Subtercola boreus]RFA29670.1 sugar ABC transporter substrate-binding protein [Subtercola boreus]
MKKKVVLSLLASAAMVVSLAACSSGSSSSGSSTDGAAAGAGGLIGVAMPTKSSERWIADGNSIKTQLEAAGYTVDLEYAEDDIPTQVSQLENMITKGAKALIVASIDGTTLTNTLQNAKDNNIPVIAYDRLIRDSENVDYYATFDNYKVGVEQGTSLLTGLGVLDASGNKTGTKGPFNIELFAGSPDDNNATFFFNGAMDTLKPYIADGTLVVKSGQTDFNTVATLRWDPATAQSRMENILTSTYSDGTTKVNGILSPYDGISRGLISAVTSAGYTVGASFPIITGQDAELDSVKAINGGEQYSTVYKDTRELAKVAVAMASAVLEGKTPETNDDKTYDNGKKVVPAQLLQPVIVTKDLIKSVLIDGGYYTDAQVNG